jgi:hypothetical protein
MLFQKETALKLPKISCSTAAIESSYIQRIVEFELPLASTVYGEQAA